MTQEPPPSAMTGTIVNVKALLSSLSLVLVLLSLAFGWIWQVREHVSSATQRITVIESNRFTSRDGLVIERQLNMIRVDVGKILVQLSHLQTGFANLKIPPDSVKDRLQKIESHLSRLEDFLLSPPGGSP